MRNQLLFIVFSLLSIWACEDVVEVELNYSEERLVIEGKLNWIKETQQTEQQISLSKTTPYFQKERIPVSGARVQVIDKDEKIYSFKEKDNRINYREWIEFLLDDTPTCCHHQNKTIQKR